MEVSSFYTEAVLLKLKNMSMIAYTARVLMGMLYKVSLTSVINLWPLGLTFRMTIGRLVAPG